MTRVLVDLQGAQTPSSANRGIGRYTLAFVRSLISIRRPKWDFHFLVNGLFTESAASLSHEFGGLFGFDHVHVWWSVESSKSIDVTSGFRRSVSNCIRSEIISKIGPDVLLLTSLFEGYFDDAVVEQNIVGCDTLIVGVIYDLIPFLFPKLYLGDYRQRRWYYSMSQYVQQLDLCLAISETTRLDLIANLGCSEDRVATIHGAADQTLIGEKRGSRREFEEVAVRYGIRGKFVLYTGGNEQRKNIPFLIKAFSVIYPEFEDSVQLVIVGKIDRHSIDRIFEEANISSAPDWIVFTDFATDADLRMLYENCALFVFPSWYEGLGLPVLEAAALGAPLIGANTSSVKEIIDMPSATFDPYDTVDCGVLLRKSIADDAFRAKLQANSRAIAERYSWERTAALAVRAMDELIEGRTGAVRRACTRTSPDKPSLASISPLLPSQTGIASNAHQITPALALYFDVTSVSDQTDIDDADVMLHSRIVSADEFSAQYTDFDFIVYHIGNSHFHWKDLVQLQDCPGAVVLHDPSMAGMVTSECQKMEDPSALFRAIDSAHGLLEAVTYLTRDDRSSALNTQYSLSSWAVIPATKVLVHSHYAKQLLIQHYGEKVGKKVDVISFPMAVPEQSDRELARRSLGIAADEIVICSFGFAAQIKGSDEIVDAWIRAVRESSIPFRLIFAGKCGTEVFDHKIQERVRRAGLSHIFQITGFLSEDRYEQFLSATDIAIQLRRLGRGESSKTIADCLSRGVATIVNANGSLAEFDHNAVCMLPDQFTIVNITKAILKLALQKDVRVALGVKAREYALSAFDVNRYAQKFLSTMTSQSISVNGNRARLLRMVSRLQHLPLNKYEKFVIPEAINLTFPAEGTKSRLYFDTSPWTDLKDAASYSLLSRIPAIMSHIDPTHNMLFDLIDASKSNLAIESEKISCFFNAGLDYKFQLPRYLRSEDIIVLNIASRFDSRNIKEIQNFSFNGGKIFLVADPRTIAQNVVERKYLDEILELVMPLHPKLVVSQQDMSNLLDYLDSAKKFSDVRAEIISCSTGCFEEELISIVLNGSYEDKNVYIWDSSKRWFFQATDDRIKTKVGRKIGPLVISVGQKGHMLYGPYVDLVPGLYTLKLNAFVINSGSARLELVAEKKDKKTAYLGQIDLKGFGEGQVTIDLDFELMQHVYKTEIRLFADETTRLGVFNLAFHLN